MAKSESKNPLGPIGPCRTQASHLGLSVVDGYAVYAWSVYAVYCVVMGWLAVTDSVDVALILVSLTWLGVWGLMVRDGSHL